MEKRIFVFFVLSLLIWTSYLAMQLYLSPPPAKKGAAGQKQVAANKEKESKKEKPNLEKAASTDEENSTAEKTAENSTTEKTSEAQPLALEKKPAKPAKPKQPTAVARNFITLGSLDPASGHSMLVTFDPRGAAIHRIELNGNRYHDLDDLSGYLGHLEPSDEKNGCRVNVVGPGTPAALAGLQVGDVITAIDDESIRNATMFQDYLKKFTKPDHKFVLKVTRGEGEQQTKHGLSITLTRRPLELIQPELNSGAVAVDPSQAISPVAPASYRLTLTQVGDLKLDPRDSEIAELSSLYNREWNVKLDAANSTVEFRTNVEQAEGEKPAADLGVTVIKRFRLPKSEAAPPQQYHVNLELEFKNSGEKPQPIAYRLEGPNGLPLEGWWYTNKVGPGWGAVGARDVAHFSDRHALIGSPELIANGDKQVKANNPPTLDLLLGKKDRQFAYLAVDTQFFSAAILPSEVLSAEAGTMPKFSVAAAYALPLNKITDKRWSKTTNVSFYIDSEPAEIAAGSTVKANYLLFAGPKDPAVLEQYHLVYLNEYGWFGWVSKTLLKVMELLYIVTRNYGISIILLTVLVRLCLLPLGIRQAKSAALMQQLAPEIAKLKEKYANNLEEQAKAQRELFAKHGFNPMGGCFLMFLQLPIFIGLYRCLSVDIELREASLISGAQWCANLAGPDQLLRWKDWVWPYFSDEGNGWLGPYCNVLPLITIVLFVIQQKMFSPPATDEETKMQQNIMTFMTFFMGVLFYKVPAGLCIYFITSSLWGICERKLLPKAAPGSPPPAIAEKKSSDAPPAPGFDWSRIFGFADEELKSSKKHNKR